MSIVNVLSMLLFSGRVNIMISYAPFYQTLFKRNLTEYQLIFHEGVSANTLHRMKKGLPITTKTLDTLCFILDCEVSDVIYHDKTEEIIDKK